MDTSIETALMMKDLLKLPLCGLEGFLNLVFRLIFLLMRLSLQKLA
ncbi:hypothetical protein BTN49_0447 [Candidatus Enterovibrio escicola]|uniref:Mobile element protein n=1 Tax=Candidatus Enterovibrio escicola TaxID=1927127 RepID=A0A2A5T5J9_9GAMM|nr:hypothetical protein BTN49_0447 [Candidatus Enterovibrio escacola]